jgi:hypothetical protein
MFDPVLLFPEQASTLIYIKRRGLRLLLIIRDMGCISRFMRLQSSLPYDQMLVNYIKYSPSKTVVWIRLALVRLESLAARASIKSAPEVTRRYTVTL